MPLVNEPWFELPIVTEWTKNDETIKATCIEKVRVDVRDLPSIFGGQPEVLQAMNEFDVYVHDQEEQARREAEADARNKAH